MEEVFNGRQPSMEDDPRWKMTFGGRRLDRRRPLMKDDLRQKTTFDRRRLLMEDKRVFPTAAVCVAVRHFSKNSEKFTFAIVLKPAYKELIKDWIPRACPGACSWKSFRNQFRNEFLKCFQECNFWSIIIRLNWVKWISKKNLMGALCGIPDIWHCRPFSKVKLTRPRLKVISLVFILILLLFHYALHCIIDSSVYIEDAFKILFRLTQ